jgi:uncharacterized protein with GYD domain
MAGYIVLGKYTAQGIARIRDQVENLESAKAELKQMGIKFVGFWLTMGEYDWVGICDAPDDQTMAAYLLALGSGGGSSTQTMRAYSEKELPEILKRLPPKKE